MKVLLSMGWADKARLLSVLLLGIIMGFSTFVYMPILVVFWPLLLFLAIVQLVGQGVVMAAWTLIRWPFRGKRATPATPRAQRTPEQSAILYAFWTGVLAGSLWSIVIHWDLYMRWL